MNKPKFQPAQVVLKPGIKYSWCVCGKSKTQPFCDNVSHESTPHRPRQFEVTEQRTVWLCMCKQTKMPPYCDGTHNKLNG